MLPHDPYDPGQIKFSYKHKHLDVSVATDADVGISDLIEQFSHFLLAVGYPPNTVNKYLYPEEESSGEEE